MRRFAPSLLLFVVSLLSSGCEGKGDSAGTDTLDACTLAAASQTCPECSDGEVTCSYGTYTATENSCGGCQARAALYNTLCSAGVTDATATIEAGTSCTDPTGI